MKRSSSFVILACAVVLPALALAHAHLKQSTPANGSTVTASPDQFVLVFSESAVLTALSIQKQGETDAVKITPLPSAPAERFSIPTPKLAPGAYTLRYRNLAVDDNHVSSGAISFTVAAGH